VWDVPAGASPRSARPGYQQFAKFSPDGRWSASFATITLRHRARHRSETAVTTDGSENVINGTSDWVYEEELNLRDAFRWSPTAAHRVLRLDQTAIRPFYLVNQDSLYPTVVPVRYPRRAHRTPR